MGIADLGNVLKIFGGSDIGEEAQQELFNEVLLMVLARASSSDANIEPVEIQTIKDIVERETGSPVSDQDVRKAARTELYEKTPLDKYLTKVGRKLGAGDRLSIMRCLHEVVNSDLRVSPFEVEFFDMVSKAMQIEPDQLAELRTT